MANPLCVASPSVRKPIEVLRRCRKLANFGYTALAKWDLLGSLSAGEDDSVLDLSSLVILAGLFVGLVVGDAAYFGDAVQVQITVPPKLTGTGFTEAAAEQLFAAQVGQMGQVTSIVPTPGIEISTRPTILAVLAKPLNLDSAVVAIQTRAGVDVVTVHGVILADSTSSKLDMVTVVDMPHQVPVQIKTSQANGDPAVLLQRTAESTMEVVAPYHLALRQFVQGLNGNAPLLTQAKAVASTAVARPWVPSRATERVMLYNLLAMLALLDNDLATAQADFDLSDPIPGALPEAHGVIELNRSFLDVAAGRTAEAEQHYKSGVALTASIPVPDWHARVDTLGALVAWSRGDLIRAEALLRHAIASVPEEVGARVYLAHLLAAKGDVAAAAAEQTEADHSRHLETVFPAEVQSLFWVDPVHGGMQRRS